jgi:hypothetical protein
MIELARRRDATGDSLCVATDDPRFDEALGELFFRKVGSEYVKRFPAGTLTDTIYERFASVAEQLLRQTARLDPVPWESALRDAARRLDEAGVDWWLTGSAALAVRGIRVSPRDIDLVVWDEGAGLAASAFADALIEPAVAAERWFCRWFGRAFVGARVEWVGGITEVADHPDPTDFGLVAQAAREPVSWNGLTLFVPPLSLQRAVSLRRGLTDRVGAIDEALSSVNPSRAL